MYILLIDSDHRHNDTVSRLLQTLHHQVDQVFDGLSGLQYHQTGMYDVTLLMTTMDPAEPWKTYLTTKSDALWDRVVVVESRTNEDIVALVKQLHQQRTQSGSTLLQFGDVSFDEEHGLLYREDKSVALSPSEQQIFQALLKHPGDPVTKATIKELLWNNPEVSDNRLEVHISSLRKKISQLDSNVLIRSKRFLGYWLVLDETT